MFNNYNKVSIISDIQWLDPSCLWVKCNYSYVSFVRSYLKIHFLDNHYIADEDESYDGLRDTVLVMASCLLYCHSCVITSIYYSYSILFRNGWVWLTAPHGYCTDDHHHRMVLWKRTFPVNVVCSGILEVIVVSTVCCSSILLLLIRTKVWQWHYNDSVILLHVTARESLHLSPFYFTQQNECS